MNDIIAQGFPISLTYGSLSFLVATTVGVALGIAAAIKHNSWIDYFAVGLGIAAQALPNFIMGPILILTFTLWLGWLPGRWLEWRSMAVSESCPLSRWPHPTWDRSPGLHARRCWRF